jgi:transposase-like protein
VSAHRKYPDAIYEAAIARYQRRKETLREIAESLEIRYWTLVDWIRGFRNDRKPRQSLERQSDI